MVNSLGFELAASTVEVAIYLCQCIADKKLRSSAMHSGFALLRHVATLTNFIVGKFPINHNEP
jgi:hypothetical protein